MERGNLKQALFERCARKNPRRGKKIHVKKNPCQGASGTHDGGRKKQEKRVIKKNSFTPALKTPKLRGDHRNDDRKVPKGGGGEKRARLLSQKMVAKRGTMNALKGPTPELIRGGASTLQKYTPPPYPVQKKKGLPRKKKKSAAFERLTNRGGSGGSARKERATGVL